jgi:hypothetical protein
VEIWPEKTTVNDVLMPLAYQYGLNIIPASGETSALRCRELVDRAIAAERGALRRTLRCQKFNVFKMKER